MANICMDTVVFYSEDGSSFDKLQKMKEAIEICYPAKRPCTESGMSILFNNLKIPSEDLYLRGEVNHYTFDDSFVELICDSAWRPMTDAYDALSRYFDLKMVYMSEEPQSNLFRNTDSDGLFLETRYKIILSDCPEDGFLDKLFHNAGGDRDFYFSSESEVLKWMHENGGIQAESIQELLRIVDMDYINICEYER